MLPSAVAAELALGLASCTAHPTNPTSGSASASASASPVVFNFGTSADPLSLDPALATDMGD